MRKNLHKNGIGKDWAERLNKIYCSTGKNKPSEIANPSKNLLLELAFSLWLYVYSSWTDLKPRLTVRKPITSPVLSPTLLQILLYWAYWVHILFLWGLGYNLWPYKNLSPSFHFLHVCGSTLKMHYLKLFFCVDNWQYNPTPPLNHSNLGP